MSEREDAGAPAGFRVASLGRHSVVYGVGMLLSKAVAIVMLPIYTRWLTPADYGVLQLITMTFEVVTMVAGSRLALGIFHFYHKEDADEGRRRVLSTSFLVLAATYGGAAALTVFVAPWIAETVFGSGGVYTAYVRLAAISMAFEGLIIVPLARFQLENKSTLFVAVGMARLGLQVALNLVLLIGFDLGVLGVLTGSVITHAVVGLLLGGRMLREVGARFSAGAARAFVKFGAPLIVMQGATFITTFGDRYFLNRAGDTTQVGLYGLAYQFAFMVAAFGYSPFMTVWDPQRFVVAKRADRDVIFAQVFVYLNILLFSAALGVALFAGDVLRIIAAPEFYGAADFVPILALAIVFPCWSSHLNIGTYITEKPGYYTLAKWGAAFVAIAGYLLIVPRWLAWGAVFTALASLMTDAFLSYHFSQRLWRIEYRWGPVARLAALAGAVGAIGFFLPPLGWAASLGAHIALYAGFLALVWWLPILTPAERDEVRSRLRSLRARRRPAEVA